jgi:hypothetical protein
MIRRSPGCHLVNLLAMLLSVTTMLGCSALQLDPSSAALFTTQGTEVGAGQQISAAPSVKLEIRAAGKSPEFREIPLREGMCIQDALIETQLTRRFGRMNLELMRRNAQGLAKMDSRYEHKRNRVNPMYDYALHPGDHLVVTEDTTTVLDDMLKGLTLMRTTASR